MDDEAWSMKKMVHHEWLGKLLIEINWYVRSDFFSKDVVPITEIFNPYNSDRDGSFWLGVWRVYKSEKLSKDFD